MAFAGQGILNLGDGIPVSGEQHDKGELITENGQTTIDDISATLADMPGHFIDDTGAIGADGRYHKMMNHCAFPALDPILMVTQSPRRSTPFPCICRGSALP